MMIIAAVVALVVVMVGAGIAIGVLFNPICSARTPARSCANNSGILPSPSPAGSPSPLVTPTPITGGATASNAGETFILPAGWTVQSQDDQSITVLNPNGDGLVSVESGASSPAQTAEQYKEFIDGTLKNSSPDATNCPGSKTTSRAFNGPSGIFWEMCYTLSSGGQSIQLEAQLFAGANSDGSVHYAVVVLTSQSNVASFTRESAPILKSIQWKLS